MDALVPAFVVALLAGLGGRTQDLAPALGTHFRRPMAVIAGIALAALLNMAIAGIAGFEIGRAIDHRAARLLTGAGLILAGSGALFRVKPTPPAGRRALGPFLSSALAFFLLMLGDGAQFVTATIAAGSGHPALAASGAAAGVTIAHGPPVFLGERWSHGMPLKAIRIGAGALLVLAGIVLAIVALGLS